MLNYLKSIYNVPSVSGREKSVSDKILTIIVPMVDKVWSDSMGSLIALKKGTAPDGERKKIMLCAHMDEIGFMVTSIDDKGFIRVAPVGGINFTAAAYSTVVFENGVKGVLVPEAGTQPNDFKAEKVYVDIGARDKKDAAKKIKIGDFLTLESSLTRLCGKRICGRPMDDRIGCAVLLEIAHKLEDTECGNDVYFVFSVQEEVGLRGAGSAAYTIQPDSALVFDVTGTGDCIGSKPMECAVGDGAAVKVKDSSVICDYEIVNTLTELAKANDIKYQCELLAAGGTDTAVIQRSCGGVRAGAISIPTRYIHSGVELFDLDDADACAALAAAYVVNA